MRRAIATECNPMPFIQSVPFVQKEYPDYHGGGLPGQYFELKDAWNNVAESFPVEADTSTTEQFIYCGRLVVRGTVQDNSDGTLPTNKPFSVRAPISTDTDSANYVGVTLRSMVGNLNSAAEGDRKAGFPEKTFAPIIPLGKGVKLWVRQASGLSVTFGDDVYVALADVTTPVNLFPGEFTNAAGTNLVQVPNAIWYTTKTATDVDQIGVIQFV